MDERTRCVEAHRVLRDKGRWAGWWSHARADGADWFDTYWSILESMCAGTHRLQRDIDWGEGVAQSGLFGVRERVTVAWTREVTIDDWLVDLRSHSYVAALGHRAAKRVLMDVRSLLCEEFPTGTMLVPYETWLWIGQKR